MIRPPIGTVFLFVHPVGITKMKKNIGILTGGGDAPGLNAAIKAAVYHGNDYGYWLFGIYDGWKGLLEDGSGECMRLDYSTVRTWDRDGGTNIGSSRTNPFKVKMKDGSVVDRSDEVPQMMKKMGLDALIACGGEDTLGVAYRLAKKGVPVVGVPKTIDKDLSGTDYSIGFDTALRNCTEMIEKARTPAGSHHWVQVIEIMGRHAGHLAFWSGVAGGAYIILIPEVPFDMKKVYALVDERLSKGKKDRHYPSYAVIVVAEGAIERGGDIVTIGNKVDAFGHKQLGGIGSHVAEAIQKNTPWDARSANLGHIQRGGAPSPVDRIMASLFGTAAVDAIEQEKFGMMVSARGVAPACEISLVDLEEGVGKLNTFEAARYYDMERYNLRRELRSWKQS